MAQKGKNNNNYKHGLNGHPLYKSFSQARQRCTNPNNKHYKRCKCRWGNNTIAELTQHYLKEYEAFVKNYPRLTPTIDRMDEDGKYEIGNIKIRDRVENIRKYNSIKGHPKRKPVKAFIDGRWVRFESAMDAQRKECVHQSHISDVCRDKRKTAGGYRWRFA